nr:rhamnan synthesis F family protein [Telmatospirillum sp. J64-1]
MAKVAFVAHIYYPDLWDEMLRYLMRVKIPFDLYVTVSATAAPGTATRIKRGCPQANIHVVENKGRDILPFVSLLNSGLFTQYEAVCKIHTKKSLHLLAGSSWRRYLLSSLVAGKQGIPEGFRLLANDDSIGIVCPRGFCLDHRAWAANRQRAATLAASRGLPIEGIPLAFPAGSMFWFRPRALEWLRSLALTPEDFEPEAGQLDGTTAHAVERLLGISAAAAGLKTVELPRQFGPGLWSHYYLKLPRLSHLEAILRRKLTKSLRFGLEK